MSIRISTVYGMPLRHSAQTPVAPFANYPYPMAHVVASAFPHRLSDTTTRHFVQEAPPSYYALRCSISIYGTRTRTESGILRTQTFSYNKIVDYGRTAISPNTTFVPFRLEGVGDQFPIATAPTDGTLFFEMHGERRSPRTTHGNDVLGICSPKFPRVVGDGQYYTDVSPKIGEDTYDGVTRDIIPTFNVVGQQITIGPFFRWHPAIDKPYWIGISGLINKIQTGASFFGEYAPAVDYDLIGTGGYSHFRAGWGAGAGVVWPDVAFGEPAWSGTITTDVGVLWLVA